MHVSLIGHLIRGDHTHGVTFQHHLSPPCFFSSLTCLSKLPLTKLDQVLFRHESTWEVTTSAYKQKERARPPRCLLEVKCWEILCSCHCGAVYSVFFFFLNSCVTLSISGKNTSIMLFLKHLTRKLHLSEVDSLGVCLRVAPARHPSGTDISWTGNFKMVSFSLSTYQTGNHATMWFSWSRGAVQIGY